jgi:hypothetical protein
LPSANHDVGVQWNKMVAACLPTGDANVADHATNPAARGKYSFAFPPTPVELHKKFLIVFQRTQLSSMWLVLLEDPIRG